MQRYQAMVYTTIAIIRVLPSAFRLNRFVYAIKANRIYCLFMKPIQLEVLLFTDTRFSSTQLYEKYDICSQNNSVESKSKEACWNECIQQILPELYKKARNGKKLILWRITQAEHFLEFEFGEHPAIKEKYFSTDPYFFLESRLLS